MKRRTAIANVWLAALSPSGFAAGTVPRPWRIGLLTQHDATQGQVIVDLFLAQMRARGLERDRDFLLEVRHGERKAEVIEARAHELAALPLHLLVGGSSAAAAPLARATRTLPVIGIGMTLPVESGLVQSLARPGGNLTGSTFNPVTVAGKLLELLKEAAPDVGSVAVIRTPNYPGMNAYTAPFERTASQLRLAVHYVDAAAVADFRTREIERTGADALYVVSDSLVFPLHGQLAAYALARRMPSVGTHRLFVEAGGMLSMNADPQENFVAAADYAIRILQGADPAALPVQEPTRFQLLLNRRTAAQVGVTPTRELLLRVTELIG